MFTKKPLYQKKIDFLNAAPQEKACYDYVEHPPLAKNRFKKIAGFIFIFFAITMIGFTTKILITSTEATLKLKGGGILTQIKNLLVKDRKDIAGAKEDRINVVFLGVGGPNHEGPYLTDTIILASLKPQTGSAALISIPRDMYIVDDELGGAKINALYTFGNAQSDQSGGEVVKRAVAKTFGIDVHYFVLVDFSGFENFIDAIGGIDIYVEKTFVDNQYPAPKFKTQTVSFEKGWQHFDGKTALQYARSRHGNAAEGSDFARAARQQKMVMAVKNKILKPGVVLRPDRINKIIQILGNSIETDMELWEIAKLAQAAQEIREENIFRTVLDDAPDGELRATVGRDGSFLLVPKSNQQLISLGQNIFDPFSIQDERAQIVIQNGTAVPGLAAITQETLKQNGFTILKVENAKKQSYIKTVVFDLSHGEKPKSREYLERELKANISTFIPAELWQANQEADFVIILGKETS